MTRLMLIFFVEQREEFRVLQKILPGKRQKPDDRLAGAKLFEIELPYGGTNVVVSTFKNGEVKGLLVADMIINHPLVCAGGFGDTAKTRAAKAVTREFGGRSPHDAYAHSFRIALPAAVLFLRNAWPLPLHRVT